MAVSGATPRVTIVGGGPAGSAAALAALETGAPVTLYERAVFPRQKVCGEFLSPQGAAILDRLGSWSELVAAGAVPFRRTTIHLGSREIRHTLAEPAHGLSRYAMDAALLNFARRRGVDVRRESLVDPPPPAVLAAGRSGVTSPETDKDQRLFGFKAHFDGAVTDAVDLYFFDDCYAGVSPIEGGRTNVCALGPLRRLRQFGFDFDELLRSDPALRERLGPLARRTKWYTTGPVVTSRHLPGDVTPGIYPAGDALGFVDPFTGAGMTNAILTGRLAGAAAARGDGVESYLRRCRAAVGRVFRNAALLRAVLDTAWAERLAPFAPGQLLFRATRPRVPDLSRV